MSDKFHVVGDQVHFGPWVVMTIKEGLPATVRAALLTKLEHDANEYNRAYDDGYRDGRQSDW